MKYGRIGEDNECRKVYYQDEDAIVDEAFERLDDNLREKFEAYEKGYGTYFKDFEQWFERYAPKIWSDVLDEAFEEKEQAEFDIREERERNDARESREWQDYQNMIDREYYKDRI